MKALWRKQAERILYMLGSNLTFCRSEHSSACHTSIDQKLAFHAICYSTHFFLYLGEGIQVKGAKEMQERENKTKK